MTVPPQRLYSHIGIKFWITYKITLAQPALRIINHYFMCTNIYI